MKNEDVALLDPIEQRKLAVAKLKRAESLPRFRERRPQMVQPEIVSEGEKVQDNGDETPDTDTPPPESMESQVEVDAQMQEPSTEETEVSPVRPPYTHSDSFPKHDTTVPTHLSRLSIPNHRLSSPPPPSLPPILPPPPPPPLDQRNRLQLRRSHTTIRRQIAIQTFTGDYDLPWARPRNPVTGDKRFGIDHPLKHKQRLNPLTPRVSKEADTEANSKDRSAATTKSLRTPPMPLLLTPPPAQSPQTQHHPDISPNIRARFGAPMHFPSTSAIPKRMRSSPLLSLERKSTEKDRPVPPRLRSIIAEEEDDEDDEEEILYPTGTSHLRLRYGHDLDSSATVSLSSQQDDSNISSPGPSSSKLPIVRKQLSAQKSKFSSSSSRPGDGASNTASLSCYEMIADHEALPINGTGTLFGLGYTETIPVSSTDVSEDEAIVDAPLDASREPGPWHILDATTKELAKKVATVLSKSEIYEQLSDLPVIQAQSTLNFLQDLLDIWGLPLSYKRTFLKTSLKLSRVYDCVPRCLPIGRLKKTGDYPFARGNFGDLWRGEVEGTQVAVMQGRIFTGENDVKKVLRKMTREAIIWRQCDHPNVLPFYGIYCDSAPSSYYLVSAFMVNGSLRQYLSNTANPDRPRLALDITRGMDYLHKLSIVHGNLKGDNILISDDHRAVIAGFGISLVMGVTIFGTSSSSRKGGTVKWQPPEVLNGNPNSFSADVYSLACVYFEVFDGSIPWSDLNDGAVIMNVSVRKKHPPRPKHLAETKFPNLWWKLMVRCWAYEPSHRPTLQILMERLHVTSDILPPPPKWDKPDLARLRDPLIQGKLHIPSDLPPFFGMQSTLFGKQSVLPTTASTCLPKVSSLSPSPRVEYGNPVHFASYSSEVGRNTRGTNFSTYSSAGDESQKDEAGFHPHSSYISYSLEQVIVDAHLDVYRQEPGPWHVLDATTGKLAKQVVTALSKSDNQLSDVTAKQAQSTLDFLQDLLDIQGLPLSYKHIFLKTSLKLSRIYDCVPRCIILRGFKKRGNYPFALGHFGEVWRGEVGGTEVAVKQARIFTNGNNIKEVLRKIRREAIIWGQCDHPNVLPFCGIYRDSAPSSYCLVSPFMVNGSLRQYLNNNANPDRHRLGLDITRGMDYLHKMTIVHGDLKGDNILISDDHRAVIADFGISFVMGATTFGTSSSSRKGGTVRWQAPEVLNANPNSFSADVYSLACVYFEVFDGSMPWSDLIDGAVIMNVCVRKKHPPCPRYLSETDLWWVLMLKCWAHEPSGRPTLQYLMESLHATNDTLTSVMKWDKSILTRLRNPLVQGKLVIPSGLPPFLNVEGVSQAPWLI